MAWPLKKLHDKFFKSLKIIEMEFVNVRSPWKDAGIRVSGNYALDVPARGNSSNPGIRV
jgi:hypothetical protein